MAGGTGRTGEKTGESAVVSGVELIGGPERRRIVIVEYRPQWVERFARERARIVAALGPAAVLVEHIGSTSVPGLGAKPIVDIQVSVADLEDEASYAEALHGAGYLLRVRSRGHNRMFRTPEIDVHVHVCSAGGEWERRHLLFRDWLRHDPADCVVYERRKRELATIDWPSTHVYSEAKSPIIAEISMRADRWAGRTGWTVPASSR
jgi:GrpB-like predicted nucleotidyltransferase (UPF0157 family)